MGGDQERIVVREAVGAARVEPSRVMGGVAAEAVRDHGRPTVATELGAEVLCLHARQVC